ncbi:hypothetical protein AYI68_g5094 [Smittium mucronatum]|uniref:Uncharacterized protein n=1 Tax=Smittium mucronatum TaxID=133383 RepID=A0A1R0GVA7_9FUNG|nr:hypothetical protein AYI68_g5094 [Smittium mucronatum]
MLVFILVLVSLSEEISLYSAMGIFMRNHWLAEEDRGSVTSVSISSKTPALGDDLDPSINLVGEPVMENLVSFLLEISIISGPRSRVRFSPIIPTMEAIKKLSVVSTGSNWRSVDRLSKGEIPALRSLLG